MTAIRVDSIVVDPTVAIRPLNEKHVNHLVKVTFDPGEVLPPIVVFYDGASYVLADGAHRLEAKRFAKTGRAEHAHIEADVRAGGVLDARAWACRANVEHGFGSRPLTRAERAEAVDGYLRAIHALGRHESDADVGRIFGVSYKTIERQRTHLQLARTIVQAPPDAAQPVETPRVTSEDVVKNDPEIVAPIRQRAPKLDPVTRQTIVERRTAGEKLATIAEDLGVNYATAQAVAARAGVVRPPRPTVTPARAPAGPSDREIRVLRNAINNVIGKLNEHETKLILAVASDPRSPRRAHRTPRQRHPNPTSSCLTRMLRGSRTVSGDGWSRSVCATSSSICPSSASRTGTT